MKQLYEPVVSARVPRAQREALGQLAAAADRNISQELRIALRQYLLLAGFAPASRGAQTN